MNKIIIYFVAASILLFSAYAGTQAGVHVNSTLFFYGENCSTFLECTSNSCVAGTCACVTDADCVYGGNCVAPTCFSNAYIRTEYLKYSPGVLMKITGVNYTPDSVISLNIFNSTKNLSIFPINVNVNSSGDFVYFWNTSNDYGNFTVEGAGIARYVDHANTSVEILEPFGFSGKVQNSTNGTTPSNVYLYFNDGALLAIDDEVYVFNLSYGTVYDIVVMPGGINALKKIFINNVVSQGPLGDFLMIDDVPESNSNFKNFESLNAFNPLFSNFGNIIVTFTHSNNVEIYKCLDWNTTSRRCNDDVAGWQLIATSAGTETNISFDYGDPGIGIFKKTISAGGSGSSSHSSVVMPPGDGTNATQNNLTEEIVSSVDIEESKTFYPSKPNSFVLDEIIQILNVYWLMLFLSLFMILSLYLFLFNKKKKHDIYYYIKKANKALEKEKIDDAKKLYELIREMYGELSKKEKEKAYPKVNDLKKDIESAIKANSKN